LTSDRRHEANVVNAKASTGPRSKAGKARSSKNALRHGLNVSIWDDAALTSRAKDLALRIAGPKSDTERLVRARAIAEAQFTLDRVRVRRMRLLQEPPPPSPSDVKGRLQQPIDASELKPVEPLPFDIEIGEKVLHRIPIDADQDLITTMDDQKLEFERLEYYERRALSRRKHAIRDFDAHHPPAEARTR
jgi:hypothetical protein